MGKKFTVKDECIKICEAIWSCQNDEQKDGCYNMLNTYIQKNGDENVGVTFIQLELARLEKTIIQMKARQEKMAEMQKKTAEHNEQTEQRRQEIEKEVNEKKSVATMNKKAQVIPLNTKETKTD